jgi:hypothetical protein
MSTAPPQNGFYKIPYSALRIRTWDEKDSRIPTRTSSAGKVAEPKCRPIAIV